MLARKLPLVRNPPSCLYCNLIIPRRISGHSTVYESEAFSFLFLFSFRVLGTKDPRNWNLYAQYC